MLIKRKFLIINLTILLIETHIICANAKSLPQSKKNELWNKSRRLPQNESVLYTLPKPIKDTSSSSQKEDNLSSAYMNNVEYNLRLRQLMEELVLRSHFESLPDKTSQQYLETTHEQEADYFSNYGQSSAPLFTIKTENTPPELNKNSSFDYSKLQYMANQNLKKNVNRTVLPDAQKIRQQLDFLHKNAEKFKNFQEVHERSKNSTSLSNDLDVQSLENKITSNGTNINEISDVKIYIDNTIQKDNIFPNISSKTTVENITQSPQSIFNSTDTKNNNSSLEEYLISNQNYTAPISLADFLRKMYSEPISSDVIGNNVHQVSQMNTSNYPLYNQNSKIGTEYNISYPNDTISEFNTQNKTISKNPSSSNKFEINKIQANVSEISNIHMITNLLTAERMIEENNITHSSDIDFQGSEHWKPFFSNLNLESRNKNMNTNNISVRMEDSIANYSKLDVYKNVSQPVNNKSVITVTGGIVDNYKQENLQYFTDKVFDEKSKIRLSGKDEGSTEYDFRNFSSEFEKRNKSHISNNNVENLQITTESSNPIYFGNFEYMLTEETTENFEGYFSTEFSQDINETSLNAMSSSMASKIILTTESPVLMDSLSTNVVETYENLTTDGNLNSDISYNTYPSGTKSTNLNTKTLLKTESPKFEDTTTDRSLEFLEQASTNKAVTYEHFKTNDYLTPELIHSEEKQQTSESSSIIFTETIPIEQIAENVESNFTNVSKLTKNSESTRTETPITKTFYNVFSVQSTLNNPSSNIFETSSEIVYTTSNYSLTTIAPLQNNQLTMETFNGDNTAAFTEYETQSTTESSDIKLTEYFESSAPQQIKGNFGNIDDFQRNHNFRLIKNSNNLEIMIDTSIKNSESKFDEQTTESLHKNKAKSFEKNNSITGLDFYNKATTESDDVKFTEYFKSTLPPEIIENSENYYTSEKTFLDQTTESLLKIKAESFEKNNLMSNLDFDNKATTESDDVTTGTTFLEQTTESFNDYHTIESYDKFALDNTSDSSQTPSTGLPSTSKLTLHENFIEPLNSDNVTENLDSNIQPATELPDTKFIEYFESTPPEETTEILGSYITTESPKNLDSKFYENTAEGFKANVHNFSLSDTSTYSPTRNTPQIANRLPIDVPHQSNQINDIKAERFIHSETGTITTNDLNVEFTKHFNTTSLENITERTTEIINSFFNEKFDSAISNESAEDFRNYSLTESPQITTEIVNVKFAEKSGSSNLESIKEYSESYLSTQTITEHPNLIFNENFESTLPDNMTESYFTNESLQTTRFESAPHKAIKENSTSYLASESQNSIFTENFFFTIPDETTEGFKNDFTTESSQNNGTESTNSIFTENVLSTISEETTEGLKHEFTTESSQNNETESTNLIFADNILSTIPDETTESLKPDFTTESPQNNKAESPNSIFTENLLSIIPDETTEAFKNDVITESSQNNETESPNLIFTKNLLSTIPDETTEGLKHDFTTESSQNNETESTKSIFADNILYTIPDETTEAFKNYFITESSQNNETESPNSIFAGNFFFTIPDETTEGFKNDFTTDYSQNNETEPPNLIFTENLLSIIPDETTEGLKHDFTTESSQNNETESTKSIFADNILYTILDGTTKGLKTDFTTEFFQNNETESPNLIFTENLLSTIPDETTEGLKHDFTTESSQNNETESTNSIFADNILSTIPDETTEGLKLDFTTESPRNNKAKSPNSIFTENLLYIIPEETLATDMYPSTTQHPEYEDIITNDIITIYENLNIEKTPTVLQNYSPEDYGNIIPVDDLTSSNNTPNFFVNNNKSTSNKTTNVHLPKAKQNEQNLQYDQTTEQPTIQTINHIIRIQNSTNSISNITNSNNAVFEMKDKITELLTTTASNNQYSNLYSNFNTSELPQDNISLEYQNEDSFEKYFESDSNESQSNEIINESINNEMDYIDGDGNHTTELAETSDIFNITTNESEQYNKAKNEIDGALSTTTIQPFIEEITTVRNDNSGSKQLTTKNLQNSELSNTEIKIEDLQINVGAEIDSTDSPNSPNLSIPISRDFQKYSDGKLEHIETSSYISINESKNTFTSQKPLLKYSSTSDNMQLNTRFSDINTESLIEEKSSGNSIQNQIITNVQKSKFGTSNFLENLMFPEHGYIATEHFSSTHQPSKTEQESVFKLEEYDNLKESNVREDENNKNQKPYGEPMFLKNISKPNYDNKTFDFSNQNKSLIQNMTDVSIEKLDNSSNINDDQISAVTEVVWLTQSSSYQKPSVIIENIPYETSIPGPLLPITNELTNTGKVTVLKPEETPDNLNELIAIIGNSLQESVPQISEHLQQKEYEKVNQNNYNSSKVHNLQLIQEDVTSTVNCHTSSMSIAIPSAAENDVGDDDVIEETEGEINSNDRSVVIEKIIDKQNIENWSKFKNNQLNNDSLTKSDNLVMNDNADDVTNTYTNDVDVDVNVNATDNDCCDEGASTSSNKKDMRLEMKIEYEYIANRKNYKNSGDRDVDNRNNDTRSIILQQKEHRTNTEFKTLQSDEGIHEMPTIENKLLDISKHKSNVMITTESISYDKHEMVNNQNSKKDYPNKGNEVINKNNSNINLNLISDIKTTNEVENYGIPLEKTEGNESPNASIRNMLHNLLKTQSFPAMPPYYSNANHTNANKNTPASAQTKEEITTTNWWNSLPYAEIRKFLNSIFDSVMSNNEFTLTGSIDTSKTQRTISTTTPPPTTSTARDNKMKTLNGRKSKKEQWPTWIFNNIWSSII